MVFRKTGDVKYIAEVSVDEAETSTLDAADSKSSATSSTVSSSPPTTVPTPSTDK